MKVIDPGHKFELDVLDGLGPHVVTFVKREGSKYPGNLGHYAGINLQEIFRACISRLKYLDKQERDPANQKCIDHLRHCIFALEIRAAIRHRRALDLFTDVHVEDLETCKKCGHIGCKGQCHPDT